MAASAPETAQTVAQNESTGFIISPDEGYSIDAVGGCDGALEGTTYTTGESTADCTIMASVFYWAFLIAISLLIGRWVIFDKAAEAICFGYGIANRRTAEWPAVKSGY